jgi:acyl carrier protein
LPDGNIEFLGREDLQVKVRGYRIELGEIEAVLGQYPNVQTAIVAAFGEQHSHKNLAAYFVTDTKPAPTPDELHSFLSQKLPSYMVPSIFIELDNLPLSSNGKVNRRALPTPDLAKSELTLIFVEPRTLTEKTLAKIWAEVLEIEQVGIHDNFFFNLGGNSLLATQVMSRIRETFQVELPLRHFFETPTVAHLAVTIAEKLALDSDSEMLAQALAELEHLSEDEVQAILASQQ